MPKRAGKIARFVLRWTIAVVGVVWVVSNLHLRDRVRVLDERNIPFEAVLLGDAQGETRFEYLDPQTEQAVVVGRDRLVNAPDRKSVMIDKQSRTLLGMRLSGDDVQELLILDDEANRGVFVPPPPGFELDVPNPLIEPGLSTMVNQANGWLLVASVMVMPATYLFTTIRWHRLLGALGIVLPLTRTFVLNMVGAFYNTFMLGSTGGDVLKAYYAAKQAPLRRTAAVLSVFIDRALGLLALVMLGGTMAALQYAMADDRTDRVAQACLHVAIVAAVLLAVALASSVLIYWRGLRQSLGLVRLVEMLPMQPRVQKVVDVVRLYRERPALIFWAIVITFPVHVTVVISAMLAGRAFGLPISDVYYFTVVPVVVLVGAIPISPQGVGVMEAFAFYLTRQQGSTVTQALALTMSIRLVQMLWNLTGGLLVLRGGYHTPTEQEQATLEAAAEAEESGSEEEAGDAKPEATDARPAMPLREP